MYAKSTTMASKNKWARFSVFDSTEEQQLAGNDCFQLPLSVFTVTDERQAGYNWHSFLGDCSSDRRADRISLLL